MIFIVLADSVKSDKSCLLLKHRVTISIESDRFYVGLGSDSLCRDLCMQTLTAMHLCICDGVYAVLLNIVDQ